MYTSDKLAIASPKISEHIKDMRLGHQQTAVAKYPINKKYGTEIYKTEITANIHKYSGCGLLGCNTV